MKTPPALHTSASNETDIHFSNTISQPRKFFLYSCDFGIICDEDARSITYSGASPKSSLSIPSSPMNTKDYNNENAHSSELNRMQPNPFHMSQTSSSLQSSSSKNNSAGNKKSNHNNESPSPHSFKCGERITVRSSELQQHFHAADCLMHSITSALPFSLLPSSLPPASIRQPPPFPPREPHPLMSRLPAHLSHRNPPTLTPESSVFSSLQLTYQQNIDQPFSVANMASRMYESISSSVIGNVQFAPEETLQSSSSCHSKSTCREIRGGVETPRVVHLPPPGALKKAIQLDSSDSRRSSTNQTILNSEINALQNLSGDAALKSQHFEGIQRSSRWTINSSSVADNSQDNEMNNRDHKVKLSHTVQVVKLNNSSSSSFNNNSFLNDSNHSNSVARSRQLHDQSGKNHYQVNNYKKNNRESESLRDSSSNVLQEKQEQEKLRIIPPLDLKNLGGNFKQLSSNNNNSSLLGRHFLNTSSLTSQRDNNSASYNSGVNIQSRIRRPQRNIHGRSVDLETSTMCAADGVFHIGQSLLAVQFLEVQIETRQSSDCVITPRGAEVPSFMQIVDVETIPLKKNPSHASATYWLYRDLLTATTTLITSQFCMHEFATILTPSAVRPAPLSPRTVLARSSRLQAETARKAYSSPEDPTDLALRTGQTVSKLPAGVDPLTLPKKVLPLLRDDALEAYKAARLAAKGPGLSGANLQILMQRKRRPLISRGKNNEGTKIEESVKKEDKKDDVEGETTSVRHTLAEEDHKAQNEPQPASPFRRKIQRAFLVDRKVDQNEKVDERLEINESSQHASNVISFLSQGLKSPVHKEAEDEEVKIKEGNSRKITSPDKAKHFLFMQSLNKEDIIPAEEESISSIESNPDERMKEVDDVLSFMGLDSFTSLNISSHSFIEMKSASDYNFFVMVPFEGVEVPYEMYIPPCIRPLNKISTLSILTPPPTGIDFNPEQSLSQFTPKRSIEQNVHEQQQQQQQQEQTHHHQLVPSWNATLHSRVYRLFLEVCRTPGSSANIDPQIHSLNSTKNGADDKSTMDSKPSSSFTQNILNSARIMFRTDVFIDKKPKRPEIVSGLSVGESQNSAITSLGASIPSLINFFYTRGLLPSFPGFRVPISIPSVEFSRNNMINDVEKLSTRTFEHAISKCFREIWVDTPLIFENRGSKRLSCLGFAKVLISLVEGNFQNLQLVSVSEFAFRMCEPVRNIMTPSTAMLERLECVLSLLESAQCEIYGSHKSSIMNKGNVSLVKLESFRSFGK